MSSVIRYFMLFSVCVILAGCAPQPSQSKVAVVELSKALTDSGYGAKIDSIVNVEKAKYNQQLGGLQNQMLQMLNKKKTEYGKEPNDDQKKELNVLQNQVGQQLRLASNRANQELGRLSNLLVGQFRTKLLSPNVEKIAKDKGFDIVILQNPDMIAFNKNVNITESVVEAIKAGEEVELKLPENPNARPPAPKNGNGTAGGNPFVNPSAPVKKPVDKGETSSKDDKKPEEKPAVKEDKKANDKKEEASKSSDDKKEASKKPKEAEEKKESAEKDSKKEESKTEKKE